MGKTRVWLLGIICCLVVCLAGCGQKTSTEEKGKGKTLEYTVVPAEDVPDTLKKEIDKKKVNKFQITYEEGEFFYLASGYGERPSFGYNIKVNDLYSKGDVLYLDTTLTGPEEGAVVKKAPSYPFIVIKLKASGTDKKVEFIM